MAAVATGLVAAALTFVFLGNQTPGPSSQTVETMSILVASRDLGQDTNLDSSSDVEELKVPVTMGDFIRRCISPAERDLLEGRRLIRAVPAGSPITFADLIAAEIELKGDRRAMTLHLTGAGALPGLLAPGQWVKILATRPVKKTAPAPTPTDNQDPSAALLSALSANLADETQAWESEFVPTSDDMFKVLAIGGSMAPIPALVQRDDDGSSSGQSSIVTIEVTEDQARIILAKSGGGRIPLTLILCPRVERLSN
ncbi:MAG: SAF domain-containing protein [Phycisphaeraceae bacterium]